MPHFPDLDGFRSAARDADVVPVYRQMLGDRLTPVAAFEVLGRDEHAFLFESFGSRFSFIGTGPSSVFLVFDGKAAIVRGYQRPEEFQTRDPLGDVERELLPNRRCRRDPALPNFTGGLVGYVGYDAARYYAADDALERAPQDDRRLPDVLFGLYAELVIFDHDERTVKVVANADLTKFAGDSNHVEAAYRDACRRIDELVQRLQQPPLMHLAEIDPASRAPHLVPSANQAPEQFDVALKAAHRAVRGGEVSRLCPSLRLRVASDARPLDVYRALRAIDRPGHMYFLKSPVCSLIGAAAASFGPVDLRQAIPDESVTGTPQRRAMRLLDEIEPARRSPFGGAIARINFSRASQTCGTSRMIVWHNGSFDVQNCAQVTGDTIPGNTHSALTREATPLLRAIELAQHWM
jgi:anthranilate synthase component 1